MEDEVDSLMYDAENDISFFVRFSNVLFFSFKNVISLQQKLIQFLMTYHYFNTGCGKGRSEVLNDYSKKIGTTPEKVVYSAWVSKVMSPRSDALSLAIYAVFSSVLAYIVRNCRDILSNRDLQFFPEKESALCYSNCDSKKSRILILGWAVTVVVRLKTIIKI